MQLLKLPLKFNFRNKRLLRILLVFLLIGVVFVAVNIININALPNATLVVEYGDVYISSNDRDYTQIRQQESEVNSGVFIKTGQGKANIILPNNSVISVAENTKIQLVYSKSNIDILQIFGNTWHRVRNLGGVSYRVNTPNAIAAVRGTEFSVEVSNVANEIQTKVMVTEHQVDLSQNAPPNMDLKVDEGMIGEVRGSSAVKVESIPETDKETQWYKDNQKLTSILNTTEKTESPQTNNEIIKKTIQEKTPEINPTLSLPNTPTPSVVPTSTPVAGQNNKIQPSPTPVAPPEPGEVYIDQVVSVNGTFGHCCGDLSSDPAVAQSYVTGAPDSPPASNFIQISDNAIIILKFSNNKVVDKPGADIRIYTYDKLYPSSAAIAVGEGPNCLATQYVTLGTFPDTSNIDLDIAGTGFSSVQCIRINDLPAENDPYPMLGFDLDAIEALHSEIVY